jgi:DNA-binding transcriptional regulator YhcF (GntR family)
MAPDLARADDVPVGSQLAWRLRVLIASGRLRPGDRLPGVRELANGAGVNVNTARAVYGRLEDDGLIVSHHGLGTFVADDVSAAPALERLAAEAADDARASGVDPRDLARAIYVATGSGSDVPPVGPVPGEPSGLDRATDELPGLAADERLGRRELRRQIARLEAELASYPEARGRGNAIHPLLLPKGHVAGMAELEGIRDELMQRLKDAREAAERRGERQSRARGRREAMAENAVAHKLQKVSSEEVGEPGCATWQVQPRWGPVGALMNWWRVKVSSGCPLAAS